MSTAIMHTTEGAIHRRNGTIMLLDARQLPVMWWNFRNALPVRWSENYVSLLPGDAMTVRAVVPAPGRRDRPLQIELRGVNLPARRIWIS